jgi:hypothetical protein
VTPSRLMEQPSIGIAIKWQMKTVKPMAKGASTCGQVQHLMERLTTAHIIRSMGPHRAHMKVDQLPIRVQSRMHIIEAKIYAER